MARGIQPNTTALDEVSSELDSNCKVARDLVKFELTKKYKKLVCKTKLNKKDIPGGIGSCCPDGGLWFYDDILICVFEGKKQQNRGNAIERWYKNNYICKKINPEVSYVTFACGEGTIENGTIRNTLNVSHFDGGIDAYVPTKNSVFYSIGCFMLNTIIETMKIVIEERILNVKN